MTVMSRSRSPSSDRRGMDVVCRARRVLNSVCRVNGESLARRFLPAARTAACRHAGSAQGYLPALLLHSNDDLSDSRTTRLAIG